MARMPMRSLPCIIPHGGVGITIPGIGTMDGTGTSVMVAGDLVGDGMTLGIITIIIGGIIRILTIIMGLFGQVVEVT